MNLDIPSCLHYPISKLDPMLRLKKITWQAYMEVFLISRILI